MGRITPVPFTTTHKRNGNGDFGTTEGSRRSGKIGCTFTFRYPSVNAAKTLSYGPALFGVYVAPAFAGKLNHYPFEGPEISRFARALQSIADWLAIDEKRPPDSAGCQAVFPLALRPNRIDSLPAR